MQNLHPMIWKPIRWPVNSLEIFPLTRMSRPWHFALFCSIFLFVAGGSISAASGPFALLHSLSDPATNGQSDARQGSSVAVDGNYVVVGVPSGDVTNLDSGLVKIYD